jgi:NAD(P)-dependent dehydrogenase (short-subunit alcohol dehydrogenase family)
MDIPMNLQGKTALITGAARRVGKDIALALARNGADVIVHYGRSEADAQATAQEIAALGVRAMPMQADLADPAAIDGLFERLSDHFPRLDILINSASAFQAKPVLDITAADWDTVMAVNLRAPFLLSQQAARWMGDSGGVIINIADTAGVHPWARFAHHSVSKAGLIMLTRVLAKALAPRIRVNAVVPGPVLRPEAMPPERWDKLGEVLPLRHSGSGEDVAKAVLAQIDNDFVTGAVWSVDGGDDLLGSVDML